MEDNYVEKSVVKYVNGIIVNVSAERFPVTSWSRIVQKPSTAKNNAYASTTIPMEGSTPHVTTTQAPIKYNFRKNPGKGVWVAEPKVTCNASFCNKLNLPGMQCMVIHNSVSNKKDNLWLFWNKSLPTLSVVFMSSQMVTVNVGGTLVSGVHAHVGIVQRRFLWSEMQLISEIKLPWLILGDFNAILSSKEKCGGGSPNRRFMMDFNECVNKCELLQAPKTGLAYSWSNCQHGNKRTLCNFDRAMFNQMWLQKYSDWGYTVGLRVVSDHSPLLGGSASIPKPANVPFRFQQMWLSHPQFMEAVSKCCLKKLKQALQDWNWNVFGNIHVQINDAEKKMQEAMKESDNNPFDDTILNKLVDAQNEYNSKEVQLNTLLRHKARVKWVKEGAANTNFFHTSLKIRQARNYISEIEDTNGNIISDQKQIAEILIQHFEKKFEFHEVEHVDSLLDAIPSVITKEDQEMLDVIPSEKEIKATLFNMDPNSSPGPDGFSGCFYKSCWHIIHKDIVQVIQLCWKRRFIPKGLNSNFLVLLPKSEGAKNPNHFRPIGLSNVSFKIFTKIIRTRMSSLMSKLVSSQQVAYIKGRCIQEQIVLASELVNEMKKKRRGENIGLKLDISQAYDSVR
ncbi:uncharacterized protein LOC113360063 [Papaver somniferum]|uniref:uncharacterized protein LOC113360063 n=1 Tax=Papaver somniferum TaxID=3469 RepID=UPI000E70558C|nr:uncharacterized protein LOC113360063 [Papaver somniferum]